MPNLSDYKELYHYDNKRSLVVNQMTGDIRMMKILSHYDEGVYAYIIAHKEKHIPNIFEIYKDGNNNLIVIEELIQGNTFDIVIMDQTIPYKTKLKYFLDLLDGLSFLHSAPNPIIHRDLKPSNIMLTEKGEVKILDYDAAKIYKPDSSGDTTFLGTDGVAAPEQYGFMQSDPRSDIYAVGKMLTNAFPNDTRILKIAAKASSFDPSNRYSNARELSDALTRKISPNHKLKNPFPPPGFRTRKLWKMILATIFYLFNILNLIGFHGSDDPVMNTACIIFYILIVLVGLDICNSWTGIFDILPLVNHKNFFIRSLFKFLFICAAAVILTTIIALVLVILKNINEELGPILPG